MSFSGHFWTIAPSVMQRVRPATAPAAQPWSTSVAGLDGARVQLSGALLEDAQSDAIVIVVHGLGGAIDSPYCVRAANAIAAHGMSSLRLSLRGADRSGEDFYHAGLAEDLEAAFASPQLARYRRLFVVGYSLGGHVSLHAAVRHADPRLRAVAALCAPLDLDKSAAAIDDPRRWVYRRHVLSGLKQIYAAVASKRAVPTPLSRIERVKTIREWDALTVVPRYGFANVDDYYARMSVGFQLSALRCPTLLLPSRHDPMVPPWAFESLLSSASSALTVQWVQQGGHVGYPARVAIGHGPARPLEEHVMRWFATHS